MTATAFDPRWASAPGATILDALRQRHLSVDDLADALGLSDPQARRLIRGELPIDEEIAPALATIAGGTERFWLLREKQYRESKRLLSAESLVDGLPVAQMVKWGWIAGSPSWRERNFAVLDYFGVDDSAEWQARYAARIAQAHYRTSPTFQSSDFAVAAWLRQAELRAESRRVDPWNPLDVEGVIASIRLASRSADPSEFLPKIESALATMGIVFLVIRAPNDCAVSGAAFTSSSGQRVIAVTGRYRSDDHLFFTILHELGHHVLHGADLYLDEFEDSDTSLVEAQADDFASRSLVPGGLSSLIGREQGPTMRQVLTFASRIGVGPGIVVGQLQHLGVLRRNQLNRLKRYYKWDGINLKSGRS